MSACSCSEESLSAFLDGELSAEEAGIIENHLLNCHHCREAFNRLQTISAAVRQIPRPAMNPALTERILNRVNFPFICNEGPLVRILELWGALSFLALGAAAVLSGPVLMRMLYVVFKHFEIATSLVVKLSWQLPLYRANLTLGLIYILGAVIAFYGFVRVYSDFSREDLIS
ncbi:MAG: anti-sigma factor family protein [Bacillota bacterium]